MEIVVLVITLLVGSVVVGRRSIALAARLRGRRDQVRLTCPKRGCRVDTTLVFDEARGEYVGVERCSVFADGHPRCAETCARLLNEGIPLDERPLGEDAPPSIAPATADD
jgi:hypothetical protein